MVFVHLNSFELSQNLFIIRPNSNSTFILNIESQTKMIFFKAI